MITKFNMTDEFLQELKKDAAAGKVDRNIVRCTNRFRASSVNPAIKYVDVLSCYSVQGQIVRLEYYCGEMWGLRDTDQKVTDKAEAVQQEIASTVAKLCGCEIRSGCLEA